MWSSTTYLRSSALLPCATLSVRLRSTDCNCVWAHIRLRPTLERSALLRSITPLFRSSTLAYCYIHVRLRSITFYLHSSASSQSAPTNQRQLRAENEEQVKAWDMDFTASLRELFALVATSSHSCIMLPPTRGGNSGSRVGFGSDPIMLDMTRHD